jgi:hypothetical protein
MSSSMDSLAGTGAEAFPPRTNVEARPRGSGWAVFAAVVLLVVGGLDLLYGLAAILNNDIVVVGGHGTAIADVTTWGWITLVFGAVLILTSIGLLAEMSAARWAAVVAITVGAILQFAWFPAAPLWTLLIIGLSVVVIYQLTVNWER